MKEKAKYSIKNNNGITLIALVVTIIVLIILAGISINLVLGENGIITRTKEAKELAQQAQLNEDLSLNEIMNQWSEITGEKFKTVEEMRTSGTYMQTKTTLKDNNGNLIKVPEGFKIASDSGINVTEGIVIEDKDIINGVGQNRGNQYVWIPVGEDIKKADGTTVEIILGRYVFADGENHKNSEGISLEKGTPILKQSAENYEEIVTIDSYYQELSISREGIESINKEDGLNATALNLKGFIDSVKSNEGYYIARYEASYGVNGKANSKLSDNFINKSTEVPTEEGYLWNHINQINAAKASRGLYEMIETDLINSYAWDTAIIYIQEFSGDVDYSRQDSKNTSLNNTGINEDEMCKINDLASNTREWTTEYSIGMEENNAYPCTRRGGNYNDSNYYSSARNDGSAVNSNKNYTFRVILYM